MLKGDASINQFIVNAVAEKISSLKTEDYLQKRALEGSREHAISILKKASTNKPTKEDNF